MKKIGFSILALLLFSSTTVLAVIPAPPVNQYLGTPDTQFSTLLANSELATTVCRSCHGGGAIANDLSKLGMPNLKKTNLATRHHLHLPNSTDAVRDGRIAGTNVLPPNPDLNNDGQTDEFYACLSCHTIEYNETTGTQELSDYSDCTSCHDPIVTTQSGHDRTLHHDTQKAKQGNCADCHGYVVKNLDAGQPASTRSPSSLTPWSSGKPNGDDSRINSVGTEPGNCNYCHNANYYAGTADQTSPLSSILGPLTIYPEILTHHSTGVESFTPAETGRDESVCAWCHFFNYPAEVIPDDSVPIEAWGIRGCERCHDVQSLHSIQVDVEGDGFIFGEEEPYNGHIGTPEDCWGCHGHKLDSAPPLEAITSWNMPPIGGGTSTQPVNQNLGMPDTQYQRLYDDMHPENETYACLACHRPDMAGDMLGVPNQYINPKGMPGFNPISLLTRHHRHLPDYANATRDGHIAGGDMLPPYPDSNNDGIFDTFYSCGSCHRLNYDADGMPMGIEANFNDCANCHNQQASVGEHKELWSLHHDTTKAKQGQCATCHGNLVSNLDEGVPPPIYSPTSFTPWISNKPNGDDSKINAVGTMPGNCDYCHNAESRGGTPDGTSDLSQILGQPITIYPSRHTHHSTGVPFFTPSETERDESVCSWCHAPFSSTSTIRGCERCHDVNSLHSIQVDAYGDGIVLGNEPPNFGHIGNPEDCWGCHGHSDGSVEVFEATISAQLESVDIISWEEGTELTLTLQGQMLIGLGSQWDPGTQMFAQHSVTTTIQFTDQNGHITILEPSQLASDEITVSIPETLQASHYNVQIKNNDKLSNPIAIIITVSDLDTDGDGVPDANDACVFEDATGFDANSDGCIDSISGLTVTLQTLVAEDVISPVVENSLISKIENAGKSADKDNICAAVNQVEAFKNQINAQKGNMIINEEAAGMLIDYADNNISQLLGQLLEGETCR